MNNEQNLNAGTAASMDTKPLVSGSAPTVEFCYRKPNGIVSVHYRRVDGTEDCERMKAEVAALQAKQGDKCPYFWRIAH